MAATSRPTHKDSALLCKVLYTEAAIATRVQELGASISIDYAGRNPIVACVLNGAFMFMADLVREVTCPHVVDMIRVSSYDGTRSTGVVTLSMDLSMDVQGRHVLLVEDIVDTGRTLAHLRAHLEKRGAATVEICTLLDKVERRVAHVECKYIGFQCPDEFVVGYGLDYDGALRSLPYVRAQLPYHIGVLKPEVYSS